MDTLMNARIESLSPRLMRYAKGVACAGFTQDDAFQVMATSLLERNLVEPKFVEQTDAYLICYANFEARHQVEKIHTYLRYVDEEGTLLATVASHPEVMRIVKATPIKIKIFIYFLQKIFFY